MDFLRSIGESGHLCGYASYSMFRPVVITVGLTGYVAVIRAFIDQPTPGGQITTAIYITSQIQVKSDINYNKLIWCRVSICAILYCKRFLILKQTSPVNTQLNNYLFADIHGWSVAIF